METILLFPSVLLSTSFVNLCGSKETSSKESSGCCPQNDENMILNKGSNIP